MGQYVSVVERSCASIYCKNNDEYQAVTTQRSHRAPQRKTRAYKTKHRKKKKKSLKMNDKSTDSRSFLKEQYNSQELMEQLNKYKMDNDEYKSSSITLKQENTKLINMKNDLQDEVMKLAQIITEYKQSELRRDNNAKAINSKLIELQNQIDALSKEKEEMKKALQISVAVNTKKDEYGMRKMDYLQKHEKHLIEDRVKDMLQQSSSAADVTMLIRERYKSSSFERERTEQESTCEEQEKLEAVDEEASAIRAASNEDNMSGDMFRYIDVTNEDDTDIELWKDLTLRADNHGRVSKSKAKHARAPSNLFRETESPKWDSQKVSKMKQEMQDQMVHLVESHKQSNSSYNLMQLLQQEDMNNLQ